MIGSSSSCTSRMRPSSTPSTIAATHPVMKPTTTRTRLIDTSAKISPLSSIGIAVSNTTERRRDQERIEHQRRQELPDDESDQHRRDRSSTCDAAELQPRRSCRSSAPSREYRGAPSHAFRHGRGSSERARRREQRSISLKMPRPPDCRSRGRGRSTSIVSVMRERGPTDMMPMRSASVIASAMSWVTNTMVLPVRCQMSSRTAVHAPARQRIERGERLVHQQHLRLDRERARDLQALAHAARELRRELAAVLRRDRPSPRYLSMIAGHSAFGMLAHAQPEAHVLLDGQPRQQRRAGVLEEHHPVAPGAAHRRAVEVDRCPRWRARSRRGC